LNHICTCCLSISDLILHDVLLYFHVINSLIKWKKNHSGTDNSRIKYRNRRKTQNPYSLTHKYMTANFPCFAQSILRKKGGGVKPVLCLQTSLLSEMMLSCTCFPHVIYNQANNFIIKNATILNIIHNHIFNLCDTEVAICILLVLLKRVGGLNHYLNIRYYIRSSYDIIVKQ
jgi:hypothetical protein